jgi:DNA-binding response OmpR family regulator
LLSSCARTARQLIWDLNIKGVWYVKRLQPVGTRPLQGGPTKTRYEPVLLLDPKMDRVGKLAAQLEQMGFPIRIEGSGVGALAAIKDTYFATMIVVADLEDKACLDWLDELRRAAARSWMIVVSPQCDMQTCKLIYRHGGDACVRAPATMDQLAGRLTAFQLRARPIY